MVSPVKGLGKWLEIKTSYQNGEGTLRELSERFNVSFPAINARCYREGWKRQQQEIAAQVQSNVIQIATNEATRWVSDTIKRSYRYRKDIDATRSQCASTPEGDALLEPSDLKDLVSVENTLDSMARRSLGLADRVDLTTNGQDLGSSFISAISKLREDASTPRLTSEQVTEVINAEIID